MAKSILFASIFATAALMLVTSLTPAMAEWTYGSEENRGVTTFDPNESVWTYGSFGISEGTSFQATSVWTFGSEENRGVTTFDAEESVWTVGSYQFGAMTESKPVIESESLVKAPETANSEKSTIQEDNEISAGKYCVQTRLGLSCN